MVFTTNKEKGNSGLVAAIAYYGFRGYTISLPLNDTQDYDLIVDNGKKLLKVQVKATGQRSEYGYTIVNVASSGGTSGKVYKTVKDTDIDILFVVTEKQELYEIPIEEVTTEKTLNLGPDRQCFRVDNIDTEYISKIQHTEKEIKYCTECGKILGKRNNSGLCVSCTNKKHRKVERPSREELKNLIRTTPFTTIATQYGVSDKTISKWCKAEGLPSRKKDINSYSNTEWEKI